MFAISVTSRVYAKRNVRLSRDFVRVEAFCHRSCKIGGCCRSLAPSTRFSLRKGEVSDSEHIIVDMLLWVEAMQKTVG